MINKEYICNLGLEYVNEYSFDDTHSSFVFKNNNVCFIVDDNICANNEKVVEEEGLYGLEKVTRTIKVPTAKYEIFIKETYSKHNKYDSTYFIVKYSKEDQERMTSYQEAIDLFYKICYEN